MNFSSESQVAGKSINGDAKNFRDDRKYCGQQSSSKSPNILEQLDHLRFNEKLAQKSYPKWVIKVMTSGNRIYIQSSFGVCPLGGIVLFKMRIYQLYAIF